MCFLWNFLPRQLAMASAAILLQPALISSAFAACDAGNSGELGDFREITTNFNANTKGNESKLAVKSALGRAADQIHFVHKLETPSSACKTGANARGETVAVRATRFKDGESGEPIGGYWKSSVRICFVVVNASTQFAIYEYGGDGAYSGSWSSEQIENKKNKPHAVSHIQFYKCDPTDKPRTGQLVLKKKIVNEDGDVKLPETSFTLNVDGTEKRSAAARFSGNFEGGSVREARAVDSPFTLTEGDYTISEGEMPHAPVGRKWVKSGVSCKVEKDGGDGAQSVIHEEEGKIRLAAGETIACTVTNKLMKEHKKAKLKIKKKTMGGYGVFTFAISEKPERQKEIAPFVLETTASGKTSQGYDLSDLVPGKYVFSETANSGSWTLESISCKGSGWEAEVVDGKGSITLQSGAQAECTFINELEQEVKSASITIKKVVNGDVRGERFYFEATGEGLVPFSLAPPSQVEKVFANLSRGKYSVTEQLSDGWFGEVSCEGGKVNVEGLKAEIEVEAGENVVCTYTNTRKTGKLVVSKRAIGGNDKFYFKVVGTEGYSEKFKLAGGDEK